MDSPEILVRAAALLLGSLSCMSSVGPDGHKDGNTPSDTGSPVDPGVEVCPGWSPVIAFGGFATPAGEGLASAISQGWGWIVPPPIGGCYGGCTASTTIDDDGYPVNYTYSWSTAGELVDGTIDYGDGNTAHMTLAYNASGQVTVHTQARQLGTSGERTDFTYDSNGELLGWHLWEDVGSDRHELWSDYENTYDGRELVATRVTYNDSWNGNNPFLVLEQSYAWSAGRLVGGATVSEATHDGCVPESRTEVEYDEEGRRSSEASSGDGCDEPAWNAVTNYSYDDNGRLAGVDYERSGESSLTYRHRLKYDAFGRVSEHTWDQDQAAVVYRYDCSN